ncbi:MAG TPA: Arc family DNA-binding protein [Polyangia bacterium]|nr:Arc family DNA-binding protein [Polyangia bacterium]
MTAAAKPNTAVLYVRLPARTKAKLVKIAKKNKRKIAAEVEIAIDRHIEAETEGT